MERPQCVKRTRLELGEKFASLCSLCSDIRNGETWAELNGFVASHTVCAQHLPVYAPGIPQRIIEEQRALENIFI